MKIEDPEQTKAVFADTNVGDVFEFAEDIAMRIVETDDDDQVVNAVVLSSGQTWCINDDDEVVLLPNAVLTVNR